MKFTVLTLFPEQISQCLQFGVIGKALQKAVIELETVQIRDYAINSYGQVDDTLAGGGRGMLLRPEPVVSAYKDMASSSKPDIALVTVPHGRLFNQDMALALSKFQHVAILCGHYEGIDQRALDLIDPVPVSLGDFILTGGELVACVLIDAVSRLLPGVLPSQEAWQNESFADGLLSERQYTKPRSYEGKDVPDVLLSGHDARIKEFRKHDSIDQTLRYRPELLAKANLSYKDYISYLEAKK